MELARYIPSSAASLCTMAMHPSKSVSSAHTSAPFARGCTNCAVVTLPLGSNTTDGIPADAQYAASAAEVSPVDAHAMARIGVPSSIICFTVLTNTVMPRSLKEPVWLLPQFLIHTSLRPIVRP